MAYLFLKEFFEILNFEKYSADDKKYHKLPSMQSINKSYIFFLDENSVSVQVACEQHYSWSSLGFVRSVATGPAICHALSSQRWIDLLLKILEEEKAHQQSNVSKQVNCFF